MPRNNITCDRPSCLVRWLKLAFRKGVCPCYSESAIPHGVAMCFILWIHSSCSPCGEILKLIDLDDDELVLWTLFWSPYGHGIAEVLLHLPEKAGRLSQSLRITPFYTAEHPKEQNGQYHNFPSPLAVLRFCHRLGWDWRM